LTAPVVFLMGVWLNVFLNAGSSAKLNRGSAGAPKLIAADAQLRQHNF
jgi:hypothetical protein